MYDSKKMQMKSWMKESKRGFQSLMDGFSEKKIEELEEIKDEFRENMSELRDEFLDADSDRERDEVREEIEELQEEYYDEMKELFADNEEALEIIEKQERFSMQDIEMRMNRDKKRDGFRSDRKGFVKAYKWSFIERIGDRLDKIPVENLDKALEKIESRIESLEDSDMDEERKEARLDAYYALVEIIQDKLDDEETETDIQNILENILG